MNPLSVDLAELGWAAWNLEYRRVGGGGGWPATFDDVAAGIDALADQPDLDLGTVSVVGHSAGGHLALWAAARPGIPSGAPGATTGAVALAVKIGAAVSLAGVTDLAMAADGNVGADAVHRLMGGRPDEVPDRYGLASPAARLPLGVPQLLVHGEDDRVVPVELSRRYAAEATRLGDPVTLTVLPGIGHMELIDPASPAWRGAVAWLESVLGGTASGLDKEADADR